MTPEQKAKLLAALDAKQAVVAEAAARASTVAEAEARSGQEQQQLGPQELRTEVGGQLRGRGMPMLASSCSLAVLRPDKWVMPCELQVVEELMSITDGQVVLKQQRDPGE